jgi:accessory Sec system glycosylation protein GtfA
MIAAVAEAKKDIPDISLDIYGKGGAADDLEAQIKKLKAQDYIKLMGQHNLEDVYIKYEAYLSTSTSEGFGLTLMEAVGSGLPIIGFDVRYGNKAFIDNGKNGYRIPFSVGMESSRRQKKLVEAIKKLFLEDDMEKFSKHSYKKAKAYLTSEVEAEWKELVNKK